MFPVPADYASDVDLLVMLNRSLKSAAAQRICFWGCDEMSAVRTQSQKAKKKCVKKNTQINECAEKVAKLCVLIRSIIVLPAQKVLKEDGAQSEPFHPCLRVKELDARSPNPPTRSPS